MPPLIIYLDQIRTLEEANKSQRTPLLISDLRTARQSLSDHLNSNFDLHLKQLRLQFYSQNTKPGAYLAKQLKT